MKKQITIGKLKVVVYSSILLGITLATLSQMFIPSNPIYSSICYWIVGIGTGIGLAQGYEVTK